MALYKNKNEILSITLKFQCPFDWGMCNCKMSCEERAREVAENRQPKPCLFKRVVIMTDSYSYLNFSLDTIINEVNTAQEKENLSLNHMSHEKKEKLNLNRMSREQKYMKILISFSQMMKWMLMRIKLKMYNLI